MTIAQLTYDVREAIKQLQNDSDISNSYIMYLWDLKRAKYLRNDLNNLQKTIDDSITQTLCLELEEVSINECDQFEYDCGTIIRTKNKIPKPIELHLKSAIVNVKPTNRLSVPFSFISKEKALFSKHSPFNKGIYAFLDNDMHIYLVSELDTVKLIDCITVKGIFENPVSLQNYNTCCGCETKQSCYDELTTDYPLQSHHIDNIRLEIIKTLIDTLKVNEDMNNNSDDE